MRPQIRGVRAGGAFQFNGVSQPEVAYKANAIRTNARGVRHVSFPDGQRIEVSYPYYILRGAPVPLPHFTYPELRYPVHASGLVPGRKARRGLKSSQVLRGELSLPCTMCSPYRSHQPLSNTSTTCTSCLRLASTVWYCCARAIRYAVRARTVPPGPVYIPK